MHINTDNRQDIWKYTARFFFCAGKDLTSQWLVFRFLFLSLLLGGVSPLGAQYSGLDIAKEFRPAYQNSTRSLDGKPGKKYWQNHTAYTLYAKLDPATSFLSGQAKIKYYNESPDTLTQVIFRIHQDLYKKGTQKDYTTRIEDIHDGIQFDFFKRDGQDLDLEDPGAFRRRGALLYIPVPEGILPGQSIDFETSWSVHIPEKFHLRMGKGDESSWFIAYWYPQVAVYDDVFGWDQNPYSGFREFYQDLATFDVTIEAPNTFGVWAGAELLNPEEVYRPGFSEKIKNAHASDDVQQLITLEDIEKGRSPFSKKSKSIQWKFKADPSPDFAFTIGDHYLWDATGITLSDGRRIQVNAVYRSIAKDFHEVAEMARIAVDFFSHELPGKPYPYPVMTVVHGVNDNTSGGMEFPMICNNPTAPNRGRTADVTSHEIAHIYFPFYVLTNESRYAWMDEGWAAMLPVEYMKKVESTSNRLTRYVRELTQYVFGTLNDMPIITPTGNLSSYSYFGGSYSKPALAYFYLQEELGEDLFKKCLLEYIDRWAYKHPTPYDFFFTFNEVSERNLDWFWEAWFFQAGVPDLAIRNLQKNEAGYSLTIERKGALPVPISVQLKYEDGREETIQRSVGTWANGNDRLQIQAGAGLKEVHLGNAYIPDADYTDNIKRIK